MRRSNKIFNELTPMGWIVVGGATLILVLLVVVAILIARVYV